MNEQHNTYKNCDSLLSEHDKNNLCAECLKSKRLIWKNRTKKGLKILASITIATGTIYLLSKETINKSDLKTNSIKNLKNLKDTCQKATINSPKPFPELKPLPGQKYWNKLTQNWEINGKPFIYSLFSSII